MYSLFVTFCGFGLLIILFQKGQCSNETLTVTVGQNFRVQSGKSWSALWFATLSGQRKLVAICNRDSCTQNKSGFIATSYNHTFTLDRSYTWYIYVLEVIQVSSRLSMIDTLDNTWNIVVIGNGITLSPSSLIPDTRTTPFMTTTPAPVYKTTTPTPYSTSICFPCRTEWPTSYTPSEQSAGSSTPLVIGLSVGTSFLVLMTICISLICYIAKRKPAARILGVASQQPIDTLPYIAGVDNPPRYDQVLFVIDVNPQMNLGPTAPMPPQYESPPDYESLPPSYESVVNSYKPYNEGVI